MSYFIVTLFGPLKIFIHIMLLYFVSSSQKDILSRIVHTILPNSHQSEKQLFLSLCFHLSTKNVTSPPSVTLVGTL